MALVLGGAFLVFLWGVACWFGYQMIRQNGRLLVRLERLEEQLARDDLFPKSRPGDPGNREGLPVGVPAPEFELHDLTGATASLARWRGRELLLIFFNPKCGFCVRMLPDLAALSVDGAKGRPVPLVIASGEADENRRLFAEQGVRCPVLLQRGSEVAELYRVHGTPMGYLIDDQGRIASELAAGADALLALADAPPAPIAVNGNGHHPHRGNRALADSKINRNGLPAATPAPGFTLPALDGGELSLDAYRGRRVLLVFSDPNCGPCDELAPTLEQYHRRTAEIQILMVSRGDPSANQAKAREHGLTFPIALQKAWEISRQYAIFATPIAYLIDQKGVIIADVAVGVEPILALVSHAASPTNGRGDRPRRETRHPMRRR
jgi:peroxiredoxin